MDGKGIYLENRPKQKLESIKRMERFESLKENELEDLLRQGAVKEYGGVFCIVNPDYYSKDTGVCFNAADYYF